MKKRSRALAALALLCASAGASQAHAAGYQVLYTFTTQADGLYPSTLVKKDGLLYGTTVNGGTGACSRGCGTLFSMTPRGQKTTVYTFPDASSASPVELVAAFGRFYGLDYRDQNTQQFFTITPQGVQTRTYTVNGRKQGGLFTSLVQFGDVLAGVSENCSKIQNGEVFTLRKSAPDHPYRVLYSFRDAARDGECLTTVVDMGGILYGASIDGGDVGYGTLFSLSATGVETTITSLHQYLLTLAAVDGKLYAITRFADAITFNSFDTSGNMTTLFTFPQNEVSFSPLTYANGKFYGVSTDYLYSIDTAGNYTSLHQFDPATAQSYLYTPPPAPVLLGGSLYDPAAIGAPSSTGYIWKYTF